MGTGKMSLNGSLVFSLPLSKFPGMTESTELSKAFAKQGLKIPIRNDGKKRTMGSRTMYLN